jgi:CDP-paratose 2-epimerase
VLAGYGSNPLYMLQTNLVGTINCLELARLKGSDFIFLSTSRVYPYAKLNNISYMETETRLVWDATQKVPGWSAAGIDIDFPLDGAKTLYGATKLASEILVTEYMHLYNLHGVINRCGVVAGPWQFGKVDQGVFTYWMMAHVFKHSLTYIGYGGSGKQVRDLCHIEDLFALIDLQLNDMDTGSGKIYNIGGGKEVSLSLLECTQICREITGNKVAIDSEIGARKGDVAIYITDNRQVYEDYAWRPKRDARHILKDIYDWIVAHGKELQLLG